MRTTTTFAALAVAAAATTMLFAAPQAANALPLVKDASQVTKSNVEQAAYRGRRHWRQRHYYGNRRYHRRPGFGVYLGF